MAKSQTLTTPNIDKETEQQELLVIAGNAKWFSHFGRQVGSFLQNQTNTALYNPALNLLGIHSSELYT